MQEFQGQHRVDFGGVVPVSLEVALHYGLEPIPFEVRPGKASWVQQHFTNIPREGVAVPDPKMVELVPSEEKAFEAEGGKEMVDPCHPLGHPVIISVFGF